MELQGIAFALLDIPARYTEEYNRWYDLDHLPEHIAKGDVLGARRYVAPRDLQQLEGAQPSALTNGHPPYLTVYHLGQDFGGEAALAGWRDTDQRIIRSGRYWRDGRAAFTGRWRLARADARPSVYVVPRAVPYLAHRGVIAAIGRAPSDRGRPGALEWWAQTQLPDLFSVEGVLAALQFDPVDPEHEDLLLHLLLCEHDPALVMARLVRARRAHRALGRYPSHGNVYETVAFLPYRTIVPLDYDFEVVDHTHHP